MMDYGIVAMPTPRLLTATRSPGSAQRRHGDAAPQDVAYVLRRLGGGPETLIVVSSDLSHYHSYETARRLDLATAAAIEHGDWSSLGPRQNG